MSARPAPNRGLWFTYKLPPAGSGPGSALLQHLPEAKSRLGPKSPVRLGGDPDTGSLVKCWTLSPGSDAPYLRASVQTEVTLGLA